MEEWKECKLSDICDYGKDRIEVSSLDNSNYISTENILPNRAGVTTATTLPTGEYTPSFEIDETLVSNIRPYFKKIWRATFSGGCSADVLVFKAKENISKDYLYYVLADDEFFKYSMATSKGTKMPRGDKTSIMNYPVKLPPLSTQQKIAAILSSLDDKIELNNRINANLEQQAQALFEDFFPNVIDDDGLNKMEELITFLNGKKRPEESGIIPVFGGNGILAYTNKSNNENCCIIGRVGAYCGNVFLSQNKCWISDNAISAKSKDTGSQFFIFYLLKKANLQTRHIGSGQPLLTQGILNSISINIPQKQTIEQFNDLLKPIFDQIFNNSRQNENLVSIRDTLLPKLMNGEIEV